MDIIACVKQVPGTTKVEIDPVTGTMKRDGVANKLNPYDLFALETALELKDQFGGSLKTLSMGPPQATLALKETLWMGADEGVLLSDRKFGGADVAATSMALSLGVKQMGHYDLIICGKQTTDGDTAQVGPELAERLGIDHVANVTKILSVDADRITVEMDLDTSVEQVSIKLPCLLTIDKDANTPRLPSFVVKKKVEGHENIRVLSVADIPEADETKLGLKGSPTQVERIFPPEKKTEKVLFTGESETVAEQLHTLLKTKKFV